MPLRGKIPREEGFLGGLQYASANGAWHVLGDTLLKSRVIETGKSYLFHTELSLCSKTNSVPTADFPIQVYWNICVRMLKPDYIYRPGNNLYCRHTLLSSNWNASQGEDPPGRGISWGDTICIGKRGMACFGGSVLKHRSTELFVWGR